MSRNLSATTQAEITRMTRIIAEKVGYNVNGSMQQKSSAQMPVNSSLEQFSKEMEAFIAENILDFMSKGLGEKEALIATQQKFSGEGFTKSLNEFFRKYGGVKNMEKPSFNRAALSRKAFVPSVIPMLYLAFALVGLGFGIMIGKIVGMLATGIISGLIIGIGLGLVTHAVMLLEEGRK